MQTEYDTVRAVETYSDMVRRICLYHLKNVADTEDICQDIFMKYMLYDGSFEDAEHEKAWLIRVAINACKDHFRSLLRHKTVPLDVLAEEASVLEPGQSEVLEAVLSLPAKYKDVIYLHYYEGYSAFEIAGLVNARQNTVYSLLSRGRSILKEKLGGDGLGE